MVISDEVASYPYVTSPQVQVAMSQEAYTKYAADLPEDVTVIIDEDLVKLEGLPKRKNLLSVPATGIAQKLGRLAVANIVMLGFLAAVTDVVPPDAMKKSVLDSVPKGTEELNTKAFDLGYEHGKKQLERHKEKK